MIFCCQNKKTLSEPQPKFTLNFSIGKRDKKKEPKIMAKNDQFFIEFLPIFAFFHRLRQYLCSNGLFWGSRSRPHIRDMVMSLFLLFGPPFMTGDGQKNVHFRPRMAKHGRLVNVKRIPYLLTFLPGHYRDPPIRRKRVYIFLK